MTDKAIALATQRDYYAQACERLTLKLEALQAAQPAEPLPAGLERCEFDDCCDFCNEPEQGVFTRLIHNAEDCTEAEFHICGGCLYNAIPPNVRPVAQPEPEDLSGSFQDWWDSVADEYEVSDFKKMRRAWFAHERSAQPEPVSLTDEQIKAGWEKTFSTNNPYCPCNLKSFTKAVNWALAAAKGCV